jgi:hypothetical protein
VNIIVVSFDNHYIVGGVLRAMMMIVMIALMMVLVAGFRERFRGTASESGVGRLPRWRCRREGMFVRLMRVVMRRITPR